MTEDMCDLELDLPRSLKQKAEEAFGPPTHKFLLVVNCSNNKK